MLLDDHTQVGGTGESRHGCNLFEREISVDQQLSGAPETFFRDDLVRRFSHQSGKATFQGTPCQIDVAGNQ